MLGNATMPAPVPLPTGEALATLAHELRDPLAAILLALELHSGDGDPPARRTLTMAAHQARRAVRIVDDLFDLCAGSRDSLPLCKEAVELAAVVAGATEATAHLLAARGHWLRTTAPRKKARTPLRSSHPLPGKCSSRATPMRIKPSL